MDTTALVFNNFQKYIIKKMFQDFFAKKFKIKNVENQQVSYCNKLVQIEKKFFPFPFVAVIAYICVFVNVGKSTE